MLSWLSCLQGIWKKKRGGGSQRSRLLWVWGLFWGPFTHTLRVLVKVENKVHILNIAWWLQLKYMRVIQSDLQIQPPRISNGGASRCWIRLCSLYLNNPAPPPFNKKSNSIKIIRLYSIQITILSTIELFSCLKVALRLLILKCQHQWTPIANMSFLRLMLHIVF